MKRRIIRADAHNWAIQEWQEGGDTVERGRFAGQTKQARWKAATKFYPHLQDAANAMFREIVADNWNVTGQALVGMLEAASKEVQDHVTAIVQGANTDTLIGILQERGWQVTAGKKGRASYVEGDGDEEPE